MTITVLDSHASLGVNTNGVAYTISAGANRFLEVFVGVDHSAADTITGGTWGDADLEFSHRETSTDGGNTVVSVWYLRETAIAAATGTNITMAGVAGLDEYRISAMSFAGVDQLTPIRAKIGENGLGTITLTEARKVGLAGDYASVLVQQSSTGTNAFTSPLAEIFTVTSGGGLISAVATAALGTAGDFIAEVDTTGDRNTMGGLVLAGHFSSAVPTTASTFTDDGSGTVINQTGVGGLINLEAECDNSILLAQGDDAAYQNERSYYAYDLGAQSVHVQGELAITPYTEVVISNDTGDEGIIVESGGILSIQGFSDVRGIRTYTDRLWFKHQKREGYGAAGLQIKNGGRLDWIGGECYMPKGIEFEGTSIVNIENATIDSYDAKYDGSLSISEQQIRQSSTTCRINGLTLYRGFFTIIKVPILFKGFKPRHCTQAISFSGSTPDNNVPIIGFNTDGSNNKDLTFISGSNAIMINPVAGVRMNVGPNGSGSLVYGRGVIVHYIEHTVTTPAGTPIADACVVKLVDTDSGDRKDYGLEKFSGTAYVGDQDFTYGVQTNTEGFGQTNFIGRLNCVGVVQSGESGGQNTGTFAPDYRCDNALELGTDPFGPPGVAAFGYWALGKLGATVTTTLLSNGGENTQTSVQLLDDQGFSGTAEATIAAYTSTETGQKAYDALHVDYKSRLETIITNIDIVTDDDAGWDTAPIATGAGVTERDLIIALGGVGELPFNYLNGTITSALNFQLSNGTNADPVQYSSTLVTIYTNGSFVSNITTAGTITITSVLITGVLLTSDVILTNVQDLSNMTIDGDLEIQTAGTYNFSGVTVTGDIINSDVTGNVIINSSGGSSLSTSEPGTGNGLVDIQATVTLTVNGAIIGGSLTIFDAEDVGTDFQDLGTTLQLTDPILSSTVLYSHEGTANTVAVQLVASTYEESLVFVDLVSSDQVVTLTPQPDPFL